MIKAAFHRALFSRNGIWEEEKLIPVNGFMTSSYLGVSLLVTGHQVEDGHYARNPADEDDDHPHDPGLRRLLCIEWFLKYHVHPLGKVVSGLLWFIV